MELVKCPFCGKEIENDSFYCDQCGEELKLCPSGHGLKKGKICNDCGTKLVEAKNAGNNNTPQIDTATKAAPVSTDTQAGTTDTGAQPTNIGQQAPVAVPQPDAVEKTIRPNAAPAEPKYLVSSTLNARLELINGALIGRKAGDYTQVFGSQGYVSGTHARLQKNASWEIVDLDSSNGTFLNGQKLAANQPAAFKVGDTIAFYDLKFIVE